MHEGEDYFEQFKGMTPYFEIDEEQWDYIIHTYPKQFVREKLADILMTYPIPYADITEEDALNDFMKLKGFRWNEILTEGEWFPRKAATSEFPFTYKNSQWYFSRTNTGNSASNYFQQANRWTPDAMVSPGPKRTWETKRFMVSLLGSAYSLKLKKLGKRELRTMIGLRKYICSQFKPNVAKVFYEMFNAKTVLDFSMGWGDRLAGFYAAGCTEHYVGLDPRHENHPIYDVQRKFYEKHTGFFENNKKSNFFICPAEDFDFTEYKDYFDVVFTSPPYFSIERYSHDDNQSWVRYKNINIWNEHFLHRTLENIIPTVKKDGIIAINISDVYASSSSEKKTWLEICNPMNNFLQNHGMSYLGCIGMEMSARPNSGGAGTVANEDMFSDKTLEENKLSKNKKFAEPIWLWKKL